MERGKRAVKSNFIKTHCLICLCRRDMHHFGIKVSIIEPGFFKTNITSPDLIGADLKRLWARLPQDIKTSYGAAYIEDCE